MLEIGTIVDRRYEIVRRVGEGGMGEVYAARRLTLGDMVALKRLRPEQDSDDNRARFLTEARAAAHIRHPNVVRVFDFGDLADGEPFIVMEYLEGPTLADMVARHARIEARAALPLFAQVCAGVEAGHRRGVIHRDLKLANVIVSRTDLGDSLVKVLDFGLAVLAQQPGAERPEPDLLAGTMTHFAPEQLAGGPITPAVDVFALGVMLYELITGISPFERHDALATMTAIERGDFKPVAELVPGAPSELCAAIDLALSLDPARRPSSPEHLARAAAGPSEGVAATPARRRALSRLHGSDPIVGREHQLAELARHHRRALGGDGRIAVITGPDGQGKTYLLGAFAAAAQTGGPLVLWGRFHERQHSIAAPLDAFVRLLGERGGAGDAPMPRAVSPAGGDAVERERWRSFAAITDALATRACQQPLILMFDDLHHASALDIDCMTHLQHALAGRGTFIVAAARAASSAWRSMLDSRLAYDELVLDTLSVGQVRAWVESRYASVVLRPRDAQALERVTGGNPGLIAQTMQALEGDGRLRREEGTWVCAPLDELELAAPVADVIGARLQRNDSGVNELLEYAAVFGDEIRFDALTRAMGRSSDELEAKIRAAIASELLREDGVSTGFHYRFGIVGLRAAVLARIAPRRREQLHRRVAQTLELLYPANLDRVCGALARHYLAANEWSHALRCGARAAQVALAGADRDGATAAAQVASVARDALTAGGEAAPEDLAMLELIRGSLAAAAGRYSEACSLLSRAIEVAQHARLWSIELDARMELARAELGRGDLGAAVDRMSDAAALAAARSDRRRTLLARAHAAAYRSRAGEVATSAAELDALVGDLRGEDPVDVQASVLLARGWDLLKRGHWDDAYHDARRARELAHAGGDLPLQQRALATMAAIRSESGDSVNALPLEVQSLELARRLNLPRLEAIALANLGEAHHHLGDTAQALAQFRGALRIFVDIGDRASEGDCRVNVGRALLAADSASDAVEMLRRGRSICQETGRLEYAGIASLELGRALLATSDRAGARSELREAQRVFLAIESHLLWQAELELALVARDDGDVVASTAHAEAAAALVASQRARLSDEAHVAAFDGEVTVLADLLRSLRTRA